ncbi:MAG: hypothetical protein RLZZ369_1031 [Pseudomonadota bacterium]
MNNHAILYPIFALAWWTSCVLLLIPIARIRAGRRREIVVDDFKYGESSAVPPHVSIPNRNYMNLLELPVLFYVAGVLLLVSPCTSLTSIYLAWLYVGLRIVHSVIHLTYNKVLHRLAAFAASNAVLVALWIDVGLTILPTSCR